jgi:hypothetical protein
MSRSGPVDPVTAFIERWARSGAAERANYQIFLVELCHLLGGQADIRHYRLL